MKELCNHLTEIPWPYFFDDLGRNANPDERKEAMKTAEGFIKQMGYPANTQVQKH